jgi:predicted transcriptional regulator
MKNLSKLGASTAGEVANKLHPQVRTASTESNTTTIKRRSYSNITSTESNTTTIKRCSYSNITSTKSVRYHDDGSKKLNAHILLLSHMVYL